MTTIAEPGLFDRIQTTTLPTGTIDALMEVVPDGKRQWIEKIVLASVARNGSLDDLRRSLAWERLDRDLIARIVDSLRSEAAT